MRLVPLRPEHLAPLYRIYRRVTADVPHCRFAPSQARFAASLSPSPSEAPAGIELLVAAAAGEARGFAALRRAPAPAASGPAGAAPPAPPAEITALFAESTAVELALVEGCVSRAGAREATRLVAFPPEHGHCPVRAYNAGWGGLSDRFRSLTRVLTRGGFVPCHRELHLTCEGDQFPPAAAPAPPGIAITPGAPAGAPEDDPHEVSLRALQGTEQVGVCVYGTLAHLSDDPAAARWGYIHWLHVADGWRRRGIARHVLTRALARLAAQGCTGCWLTTGSTNWGALTLYLALGFEIVDTSTCFGKALSAPAAPPRS